MAQSIFYEPLDGLKKCEELYNALWKKENVKLDVNCSLSTQAKLTLLILFKNACEGYLCRKHVSEWKKKYL